MNVLLYCFSILVLIMLSAFFSSAEMAYTSMNRRRLEHAGKNGNSAAKLACWIYDRYDDALSAILISNNLVSISASSLASVLALYIAAQNDLDSALLTTIAAIILTVLIIVFGDVMPKIITKKSANRTATNYAYIIRVLTVVLKPVVFVVVGAIRLITIPFKGEEAADVQEEAALELANIIETVEGEGVIDEERSELLHAALDFSEISASTIMTSRVDMISIDIDDDYEEILETIDKSPYSRLPVFEDNVDNIIGVLYLNRFFKAFIDSERVDIRAILIKPCFVYKTVKLPKVLAEMRVNKTHLAIVTDEYGGSMGLVTMEDVLEQLVGEIWDETDEVVDEVVERAENLYELDGDMSISDFLEIIDRSEDSFETDSATVGGWTIEKLGYFPKEGDKFVDGALSVTVLEVSGKRVDKILLEVPPASDT